MNRSDFKNLAAILQNPEVMYVYEHNFSDNDVEVWIDRQKDIKNMDMVCGQ